ncbi:MAG: hypothetical protein IKE55_04565 [Kiritimatiellae bacterium]|nr:hypothetical protein [Kiritimatiellia bacterium]
MIIHFKHVDENAEGEQANDKGPLAFGESTDEWTALCSLHTLTIYEQAFQNDPSSPHKSLVDDVTDYGDAEEGTPLGKLLAANWEADARALWAMLKCGCEAGLNGDKMVGDFLLWSKAHAADDIDMYRLHLLLVKEIDACFPALAKATEELSRQLDRPKRKRRAKPRVHEDGADDASAGVHEG